MIKSAPLIITTLFLTSCATVFNSTYKRVEVVTNRPARIICANNGDSIFGTEFSTLVKRGKAPLKLIVVADSARTTIVEDRKLSFAYFVNLGGLFILGTAGIIIDSFTPRRFTYSGFFSVDLGNKEGEEKKEWQPPSIWRRYRNSIKFSPMKLIAVANPGLEFAYERSFGRRLGLQFRLAAISPPLSAGTYYDLNGIGIGIEPRVYFAHRLRYRWYTGLRASWSHVKFTSTYYFAPVDTSDHVTLPVESATRVDRTIGYLVPNVGFQFTTGRFVGELSFGIGVKYRHVAHLDKPPGKEFFFESRHPNAYPVIHREGNQIEVGMPASFMIGWRF